MDIIETSVKGLYEEKIDDLEKIDKSQLKYKELEPDQVEKLAEKIKALNYQERFILQSKYLYDAPIELIEDIVEVDKLPQRIIYLNKILAYSMGLKNELLASSSIKEACQILWKEEKEKDEKIKFIKDPKYSEDLKNKLLDIGIRPKRKNYRSKKLATFVIVALLSATAFFSQNSEARDAFFGWIIETFSTHSTFTPQGINDQSSNISLDDIEISYIPEGYELYQEMDLEEIYDYEFINENKDLLLISFTNLNKTRISNNINTEDANLKEIQVNGNDGFLWTVDEDNYFLIGKNGIEILIVGRVSFAEIIEIYKNININ